MARRRSAVLALAFWAAAQAARAVPTRVAIVVDGADEAQKSLAERISRSIRPGDRLPVFELEQDDISNPIEKGKLLAELQTKDLVVAVGNEATSFLTRELEDVRLYFVGAGLVKGETLASGAAGGIFSYSVEGLVDAAKAIWSGPIGFVYTPGYEPVARWARAAAEERGISIHEKKVSSLKEYSPALRDLAGRAKAVWVVGDPLLVRGAGFQFLVETSLSNDLPVIASTEWSVERGALLSFESDPVALAAEASAALGSALAGEGAALDLRPGPREGVLLMNRTLAEKWRIPAPAGVSWRTAH